MRGGLWQLTGAAGGLSVGVEDRRPPATGGGADGARDALSRRAIGVAPRGIGRADAGGGGEGVKDGVVMSTSRSMLNASSSSQNRR